MNFFEQWEDSEENNTIALGMFLVVFISLLFIITNLTSEKEKNIANIFIGMGIIPAVLLALNFITKADNPLFIGFGKDTTILFISLIVGFGLAFFLTGQGFTLTKLALTSESIFKYFFVNIASPIIEDLFFVGFLFPFAILFFQNTNIFDANAWIFALIFVSVLFGGFHYFAYGGNLTNIISAIIFRGISIVGVYTFKSLGFTMGLHAGINMLVSI